MKILFYTPFTPSKETGACKVVIELAEELEILGWNCTIIGPHEVADALPSSLRALSPRERLREYLIRYAADYDVVDYEHPYLPFPRKDFSNKPLFVARSVMLLHHIEHYAIPTGRGLKAKVGQLIKGKYRARKLRQNVNDSLRTIQQADLVNLCNDDEKATLLQNQVPIDKMVVLPFGISRTRRPLFDAISSTLPASPTVAFVGSFDYRKGANEFPAIVEQISAQVPNVRFRMLGTAGMFPTEQSVLIHFPKRLWPFLEVIPRFSATQLPSLLEPCSLGIFPSYIEGFPFGVLEMLAASLPVIAYDVPGPRMTLPPDLRVDPGDATRMSRKIIALLNDPKELTEARLWAKQRSQSFQWKEIAAITNEIYSARLEHRKANRLSYIK